MAAQQSFWQQSSEDYIGSMRLVGAYWAFAMPVTGMEETLEDRSIDSMPGGSSGRDRIDIASPIPRDETEQPKPDAASKAA